jgi:Tol biopolymer transport system component
MLLGANVNKENSFETSATITPDGNTLIFVSDRDGGKGGKDIYFSKKLPTGDWGIAENLSELNSSLDEEYPFMTDDGKTIYFASEGFNSMGGFDIFKSSWNDSTKTWSAPKNLGYPVNTPMDEWNCLCLSDKTGRLWRL